MTTKAENMEEEQSGVVDEESAVEEVADAEETALEGKVAGEAEDAENGDEAVEESLYAMELERYRATMARGAEATFERYGFTMIHSIEPGEYIRCREELGFKPQRALDWYNMGCAAAELEDWDSALKHFARCLKEDEQFAPALFNQGAVYEKREELAKAAGCYRQYCELLEGLESHVEFRVPAEEERQAEVESIRLYADKLETA